MLQLKDQCEVQNYEDCQLSQSNTEVQTCRHLQPSLFNKSSIHIVTLSNCMLKQIPAISSNTQKLDLSWNELTSFPLGLSNLKQIKINNNLIQRIPQEINDITSLRILRANNNKISTLLFLQHVRHLELNQNPIQIITTKLSESRLQFITFDWIPFLIQSVFQTKEQNMVYSLCDIIENCKLDSLTFFVRFQTLFQHRKTKLFDLTYLVHKAIQIKADWFIDFLKNHYDQLNFNALIHFDRPLLQQVLAQNYQKALQLFKIKKSNLNYPQVYMVNLILACKYNNYQYFNYVIGHGLKRYLIIQNQDEIIQTIFKNFDQNMHSIQMLNKILQLANFDQNNRKIFHLPQQFSIFEGQKISEGLIFIMKNYSLNNCFDFRYSIQEYLLHPLLHFSMNYRKPQLTIMILKRFKKPFIKNYSGKSARSIRGSTFCRKLVWKYEKLCIKQHFINCSQFNVRKSKLSDSYNFSGIIDSKKIKPNNQKYENIQNTLCESLISSQIINLQKSIHQRKAFRKLKSNKLKETIIQQFDPFQLIDSKDETGIMFQFTLNSQKNTQNYFKGGQFWRLIDKNANSLSLYETYQKSQLSTIQRNYTFDENRKSKQQTNSSIFAPFSACQEVDIQEYDKQHQRNIKVHQSAPKKFICMGNCPEASKTEEITEAYY